MVFTAATNERGVDILDAITLGPRAATALYWGLPAFAALASQLIVRMLMSRGRVRRRVLLNATLLVAPASRWPLSSEEQLIPLSSIRELGLLRTPGAQALRVIHDRGKLDIEAQRLASDETFATLTQALARATGVQPTEDLLRIFGLRRPRRTGS
jgi:hypothetical protein